MEFEGLDQFNSSVFGILSLDPTNHLFTFNFPITAPAVYGNGAGLTNVPTVGLSVTQNVAFWSGTISNLVAYTNVFANGLLVSSGQAVSTHGSSLIQPNGDYLLQFNGGTFLLP